MVSPDVVAKSIEALKVCRDLITFDPGTGEDIDPLFLNEDNRALYEGIGNVLDYIQQLKEENTKLHNANDELCRTAGRLERERDAAVKDLQTCAPCRVCKFRNRAKDDYPCDDCGFHAASNFEWRGPQEVTP